MGEIRYSYKDVPTIRAFSEDNTFLRAITGPFGSGKSSGCVIEIVNRSMNQAPDEYGVRKTRWAVVRNTYPQLRDTTIKTFHDPWLPPELFGTYKETTHDYIIDKLSLNDGTKIVAEVLFRALDRPDHIRNLLSLELTGAWFNEVREIPRMIWDTMQGRVGRYPSAADGGPTWCGMFADTNPPDTDHWFFRLFEEEKPQKCVCGKPMSKKDGIYTCPVHGVQTNGIPQTTIFHQPSGRSPQAENLPNLRKGYYDDLATGKSAEFVRVYVDGEYGFVTDGKPVYGNWSPTLHLAPKDIEPVRGLPLLISFDFGLHPACVVAQIEKTRLNVLKEFYAEMPLRPFLREIVKPFFFGNYLGFPNMFFTGDPSGVTRKDTDGNTSFRELAANGFPPIPARTNALQARLNAVDTWLTKSSGTDFKPAFQVSPGCKLLVRGFNGAYHMRRIAIQGQDRYTDEPEKTTESHVHDALQYLCMFTEDGLQRATNIQRMAPTVSRIITPASWT